MLGIAKTSDAKILQLFCLLVCVALPLLTDCAPSFTSTPNNPVYQLQGNDVILSWFYNPDGKTVDNITWSFNINQRIATKHSNGVNTDPAYTDRVEVSGSATIKLKNIQAKDSGTYYCIVKFTTFDWIINLVELIVVVGPQITLRTSGPAITIDEGNTRTLLCVASGNPKPNITWYRDNVKVQEDPNNSNYTITSATRNHAGTYRCEAVVTAPGLSINPAEYTVAVTVRYRPTVTTFTTGTTDNSVVQGTTVTLTCSANGYPAPIYTIKRGDSPVNSVEGKHVIPNIQLSDEADTYSCEPQNSEGTGPTKQLQITVLESTVPPDRGIVKGTRMADDPAVIMVTWTVIDPAVTTLSLEINEGGEGQWKPVKGASGLSKSTKDFKVTDLKADKKYRFRMDMRRPEEQNPVYVYSNIVTTAAINTNGNEMDNQKGILSTGAVREVVITIIAILVVIILALAVYLRRKRKSERIAEQSRNEPHSSEFVNEAIEIELQHSALPRTENDLVRLSHVDDEPMAAEAERSEMGGYDVPTEFIYPEELTPCTKETGPQFMEYQTLDRATMDWEIARNKVSIVKVIGEGAFGKVAKATVKDVRGIPGERTVAVKMTKAHATESERNTLLSELEIMKRLKPHPHVIKLLGCVTTSDPLMVLIEYIPYGDLLGFLRRSRGLNDKYYKDPDIMPKTSLTSDQLLKFAFEIADGMSFLAFNKIIHRDLAARNVLVGDNETCKVTDFGMARESDYERKSGGRLPVKWTAYEALMYGQYTTKSDVWSYGILLYEIFTIGGKPYPKINGRQIASFLEEGKRMAKPKHLDDYLFQIMMNCWHENPQDRPTFESLKIIMELMKTTRKELFRWEKYEKHLYENVEISELL
ncbi:uncharacterized protein LOC144636256 isoform X3 [Oculina patagonica]